MIRRTCFALAVVLVLAGCGGSGGPSGESSGGDHVSQMGLFEVRSPGITGTSTAESANVTATALQGTLTGRSLNQPLSLLDQTLCVLQYGTVVSYSHLTHPYYDAPLDPLSEYIGVGGADISPDGSRLLGWSASSALYGLNMVDLTTGAQTLVPNVPTQSLTPRWSPVKEGSKYRFAYEYYGKIYTALEDGTDIQPVSNPTGGQIDGWPSFSPDGTKIAFQRFTGSDLRIVVATYAGGVWTEGPLLNYGSHPQFTPSGNAILFIAPGNFGISRYSLIDKSIIPICGGATLNFFRQSPDGRYIAFQDGDFRMFDTQTGQTTVLSASSALMPLSWGPQTMQKSFVGTGGAFGVKSSGAIFTQTSNAAASVVSFAANDSTTGEIEMKTPTVVSGPQMVFEIGGDRLKWLAYSQAPHWKKIDVVGGTQPVGLVTGALVSLSSSTGLVSSVMTFTSPQTPSRSSKPKVTTSGGVVEVEGSLEAVFDEKGRNLAPRGASLVRIDESGTARVIR